MGCANSNLLPKVQDTNGEFVAPPYELKQASDKITQEGQGLIGTAKKMFSSDNIAAKAKETAGDIADSAPVQNVVDGVVQAKDAAVGKIQGAGESVKQTIGSFTHQTEETLGNFADQAEEKFGSLTKSAEEKIGTMVSDAETKVKETVDAVGDKIEGFMPGSKTPPGSPVKEEPMIQEIIERKVDEMPMEAEAVVEEAVEEAITDSVNQENGEVDEVLVVETEETEETEETKEESA